MHPLDRVTLNIWAENDPVNEHNNKQLDQLSSPLFVLKATDQYQSNITQQDINTVLSRARSDTGGLDFEINIKEGARVMLTTNIDITDRLINGQMGTVVKIHVNKIAQKPTVIYVKFDDERAGGMLIRNGGDTFAKQNHVVPIEPVLAKIKVHPGKPSSPELQRIQFPITLAWACTIHKVQGLTLQNVVISFKLNKQKSFNCGQVYVALSRSTSLQGLHILGKIESKHVKTDSRVHDEYERLRHLNPRDIEGIVPANEQKMLDRNTVVTMCLLNIRSLRKHSSDIKYDVNLFNSDILALTETQLLPGDIDSDIKDNLTPFTLYRHDHNSDKFLSLGICIKSNIQIVYQEHYPTINAVEFQVSCNNNILQQNVTFLLVYRKNDSDISVFINGLNYLLRTHTIHIVLGDFNINYYSCKEVKPLTSMMESLNYVQIVKRPTFLYGSLLDHVYVQHARQNMIHSSVISVYYSDHDAIRITIPT